MFSRVADRGVQGTESVLAVSHETRRKKRLIGGVLFAAAMAVTTTALAVDGCEVLLCLASPNGWGNISQCVPPMEQFLRDQALGRAFPSCKTAGNPSTRTGSFAEPMRSNFYNECPGGTQALPAGSYAIMSPTWVPADNNMNWVRQQTWYTGIGDGSGLAPTTGVPATSLPPKVCVAGSPLGEVTVHAGRRGGFMVVPVYSSVTILQPNSSPRVIGVWIDGQLYNQVHY